MASIPSSRVQELISLIDDAVDRMPGTGCCHTVKEVLEKIVLSDEEFIEPEFLQPAEGKYARRLLHLDPQGRYSVLVMVWDKGQGTSLHDHDNMWCVECVYRGRIKVTSYSFSGESDGLYAFKPEKVAFAGHGEAGALIPPFDHHTLENADESPAITLHVYGGEMTACQAFVPVEEGKYRLERRELSYTPMDR